jgi:dTDP-4-dehydrorhamnose reductase
MKIAIIGSGGRLGAALAREYGEKFQVAAFDREALDVGDERQLRGKLEPLDVDLMINCAALTNVDYCETHRDEALQINAEAPRLLAEICAAKSARLIHISTDYVFDGEKREAYIEEDPTNSISVYGDSKLQGEKNVLATDDRHLVIRVSWVFGRDRPSFIDAIIKRARESDKVDAIGDKFAVPTYTRDVAALLPVLFDSSVGGGVLHLANTGECSWQQYGQWALDCCHEQGVDLKAHMVAPLRLADMKNFIARRPVYSVLSSAKYAKLTGTSPRPWREAVADYIRGSYLKI